VSVDEQIERRNKPMEYLILLVEFLRILCSLIEIHYYRLAHKNKALLSQSNDKQHLIDSEIKSHDENQKI
jgi:hypothetical protein